MFVNCTAIILNSLHAIHIPFVMWLESFHFIFITFWCFYYGSLDLHIWNQACVGVKSESKTIEEEKKSHRMVRLFGLFRFLQFLCYCSNSPFRWGFVSRQIPYIDKDNSEFVHQWLWRLDRSTSIIPLTHKCQERATSHRTKLWTCRSKRIKQLLSAGNVGERERAKYPFYRLTAYTLSSSFDFIHINPLAICLKHAPNNLFVFFSQGRKCCVDFCAVMGILHNFLFPMTNGSFLWQSFFRVGKKVDSHFFSSLWHWWRT